MDRRLSIICSICARGGSKGVPGKNIRPLKGRPLIAHTVEQAVASRLFDVIVVSSDSPAILEAGLSAGATHTVLRPDELASDTAGKIGAIRHCLVEMEGRLGRAFDILVDLDATSPLRGIEDIAGAVALLENTQASNVITGAPARRSPYFNLVEARPDGTITLSKPMDPPVVRRQDAPLCFDMNASIYVWRRDRFLDRPAVFYDDTRLYEMPEDRSHDIDSELDFEWVTFLMERDRG
jgi:CMP-N,N'-diacetyllegionaminic acid synthase